MSNLLFLDTETTGKDETARLVQLAFKIGKDKLNMLFKPPVPISFEAMSVHHITNEMVESKKPFEGTVKELMAVLLEKNIMVAHNAQFDAGILRREGLTVGRMIDTLKVVQNLFDLSMYKLQFLRYKLGLEIGEVRAHDAEGDIEVLEALFNYLYAYMARENPEFAAHPTLLLNQMIEWTENPLLIFMKRGKYNGVRFEHVPKDYLRWLKKARENDPSKEIDPDLDFTLNYYLQCDTAEAVTESTATKLF